jgi:hypothetical protein
MVNHHFSKLFLILFLPLLILNFVYNLLVILAEDGLHHKEDHGFHIKVISNLFGEKLKMPVLLLLPWLVASLLLSIFFFLVLL